jgi:hypothetical protein
VPGQPARGGPTHSFANALRAALREDPDAVLVGELRDLETIRLALTAAETGHLVFGTLHTSSAAKTIDRIVDVFPAAEKDMVRAMLSESLVAVISQTLCKTKDGQGRVAAHEIMIGTSAIRNLIRENKVAQMYSSIQTGQSQGMQTLDQCLADLVRRNLVAASEARVSQVPRELPGLTPSHCPCSTVVTVKQLLSRLRRTADPADGTPRPDDAGFFATQLMDHEGDTQLLAPGQARASELGARPFDTVQAWRCCSSGSTRTRCSPGSKASTWVCWAATSSSSSSTAAGRSSARTSRATTWWCCSRAWWPMTACSPRAPRCGSTSARGRCAGRDVGARWRHPLLLLHRADAADRRGAAQPGTGGDDER